MIQKLGLKQWKKIKDSKTSYILYVSVPGCCPCLVVERQLIGLQKSDEDMIIYEYKLHDIEHIKEDEIVQYYNLSPFPVVLFIKDGEEIERFVGEHSDDEMMISIKKLR